ncbi:hypothetical protein PG984_016334 [Apiospora sp. TS-2023a]
MAGQLIISMFAALALPSLADGAATPRDAHSAPYHRGTSLTTSRSLNASHRVGTTSASHSLIIFAEVNVTVGLSSSCLEALGRPLDCSGLLISSRALYVWGGLSAMELDSLCTPSCASSIADYRSNVLAACADDVYTDPSQDATGYVPGTDTTNDVYNVGRISIKPIGIVDYYFLNYKLLCLQDDSHDSSEYCYLKTGNGTAYNETVEDPCGNCSLGPIRLQLEDARVYDETIASEYSASISACGITEAALATPAPVLLPNPNTGIFNATRTCSGTSIPMPTSSSCDQTALDHEVSTAQLLADNDLPAGCSSWPGSAETLCIQNTCKTYTVKDTDTCRTVSRAHNITLTQLLTWNPTVDPVCANWDHTIGHVICVSSPLGYKMPSVTIDNPGGDTPTVPAALPSSTAPGSNANCGFWYTAKDGDYCSLISTANGISLEDFYFLNPVVDSNCTNLWANYSYCAKPVGSISDYPGYSGVSTDSDPVAPAPTIIDAATLSTIAAPTYSFTTSSSLPLASGSLSGCYNEFQNTYGELSCMLFAKWMGVALRDFLRWNPSLTVGMGKDENVSRCVLRNDTAYCAAFYNNDVYTTTTTSAGYAAAPTDSTTGATSQCIEWFETDEGDTCASILEEFQISQSSFYQWNPAVGDKCQNLWLHASYCVAGPGWDTTVVPSQPPVTSVSGSSGVATTTTAPTPGSTGVPAPGPTQSGIIPSCSKYAKTQQGDSCTGFAARNDITPAKLYAWNSVLGMEGSSCGTAFWANEWYCVGVLPPSGGNTVGQTVTSGSTPTVTATSVVPPGPTQTGIPSSCNAYAVPISGDGCWSFADRNGITLDHFYKWNPAVGDCANFWGGEAYCIGVSS